MKNVLLISACIALAAAPVVAQAPAGTPMPAVALPHIPAHTFRLTDYGAIGDGRTDATAAFQKALNACAHAGGGTLEVPAGRYLVHPLTLISDLNLHLDAGATLLMDTDPADYALPHGNRNCISTVDSHDIAITGTGIIDGQGSAWWPRYVKTYVPPPGSPKPLHRPYMVTFMRCQRVLVEGVTLQNSPSFHLVPAACQDVTIKDIHILAPAHAPNTDGMDPSGWNFHITGCTFNEGDDCIALKPTTLIEPGQPSCRNFLIEHCTFLHGHGMSIGGQSPGGLENMTVRDCTFDGTDAGIRMKAPRGNGGLVENLTYENLTMTHVKVPIFITSYYPRAPKYPMQDPAQPVNNLTPIWRDIHITNLTSTGSPTAGIILGLPEMPVSNVVLTNVHITAEKGMIITHAQGIKFVNSQITVPSGPSVIIQDAQVTGIETTNGQ